MKKQVRFWWDMEDPNNVGWYAIVEHVDFAEFGGTQVITDSQKTDFPVDIMDYDVEDRDDVEGILRDHFPDYDIEQIETY